MHIVSWILGKIPTTRIITFNSFPDYADNAYAIYHYFEKNHYYKKYRLVWLINEKKNVKKVQEQIRCHNFQAKVVCKTSIIGLWYLIRCRYCFYTHGIIEMIYFKQHEDKMINMWHGMPLKNIGLTDHHEKGYKRNLNLLLANSILFQGLMAKCFGVDSKIVLPIGQPRCDLLFSETDFFVNRGIDKNKFEKIGIWLPTFRSSICGEIRTDGIYKPGCISFVDEEMLSKLDGELEKLNQLLIIKLHPMDRLQLYKFRDFSRLYPLLGNCDYLLTDFSSVCVDFDILRKPMGFLTGDLNEYSNSRGFMFDDIASVLPGPMISNYKELVSFISNPQYKPSSVELNSFYDNHASERLVHYLNI